MQKSETNKTGSAPGAAANADERYALRHHLPPTADNIGKLQSLLDITAATSDLIAKINKAADRFKDPGQKEVLYSHGKTISAVWDDLNKLF